MSFLVRFLIRFAIALAAGALTGWILVTWRSFPTRPAFYVGFATVALVYYGIGTVARLSYLWSGRGRWQIDRSADDAGGEPPAEGG